MDKYYKLVFVYPDGHIEEVDEIFYAGQEALDYGNNLLGQVTHTEKVLNRRANSDIFEERTSTEPYFMIVEIKGKKRRLVYDSLGR